MTGTPPLRCRTPRSRCPTGMRRRHRNSPLGSLRGCTTKCGKIPRCHRPSRKRFRGSSNRRRRHRHGHRPTRRRPAGTDCRSSTRCMSRRHTAQRTADPRTRWRATRTPGRTAPPIRKRPGRYPKRRRLARNSRGTCSRCTRRRRRHRGTSARRTRQRRRRWRRPGFAGSAADRRSLRGGPGRSHKPSREGPVEPYRRTLPLPGNRVSPFHWAHSHSVFEVPNPSMRLLPDGASRREKGDAPPARASVPESPADDDAGVSALEARVFDSHRLLEDGDADRPERRHRGRPEQARNDLDRRVVR